VFGGASAAESLQDAWTKALTNDATLAAAGLELPAAQANERAAKGARWPSLETGATYTRYATAPSFDFTTPAFAFRSAPLFDNNDAIMGYAQLKLPLYAGGSLHAGVQAARHAATAAAANEQQARADLKLDVAGAYFNVLRARRSLRAADSAVEGLTSHAHDVGAMVDRELVGTTDLLSAKVALANAEQLRLRAASGVEIATAQYNRRLGEPAERAPDLIENVSTNMPATDDKLGELIAAAVQQRSELAAMEALAAARTAEARAEFGKTLPQLALVAQYNRLENTVLDRQDLNSVGIGFHWNLFDAGQTRNRAAALRRDAEALQRRSADLRSIIELQVREAWLGLREARGRVTASREATAQAEENLRTSRELYRTGLATNTQVLDAVTLSLNAANNHDDALLDVEYARLKLARAVGSL
jgi:outer membrane protein TolC